MRWFSLVLGGLVLATDLLTKWWVSSSSFPRSETVIDGFFMIDYVQNEGIAFGLFHSFQSSWKPVILSAMALTAVGIVLVYIWRTSLRERVLFVALGLLLGGILGNFLDRLRHGYVVDFLRVHWRDSFSWPTFNIADAAITIGVILIIYDSFFGSEEAPEGEKVLADD
jgi:signal peptidase II